MKPYQEFIALKSYGRFLPAEGRRETWPETVDRLMAFWVKRYPDMFPVELVRPAILTLDVMPSMRSCMTAGPALERDEAAGYNCAYVAVDHPFAFDEALYLLACGTGVGFSVERQVISKLPRVADHVSAGPNSLNIVVEDSKEGWATALRTLLDELWHGRVSTWDVSNLRPKGARLKTFGGRSSGPGPLVDLFKFCVETFRGAAGRHLKSIECHDVMCEIGRAIVSGGVRRSAMISLSNLSDLRMREAKYGQFHERRYKSNNSVAYTERPEVDAFMDEMRALYTSHSGERGIFNRRGAQAKSLALRTRRVLPDDCGTNPCFASGTLIVTDKGARPIEDLVGETVTVWTGSEWQTTDSFRITGRDQKTVDITLQDGSDLRVTPYHRMILADGTDKKAGDLLPGDRVALSDVTYDGDVVALGAYLKGFGIADGTMRGNPALDLYETKYCCMERLLASAAELPVGKIRTNAVSELNFREPNPSSMNRRTMSGLAPRSESLIGWFSVYKKGLPDEIHSWNLESKAEFIAGLFDGDGTSGNTNHGWGYGIASISRQLLLDVSVMLKSMGIRSLVSIMKRAGRSSGYATLNDCWRLTLSGANATRLAQMVRFSRLPSFADKKPIYDVKSRAGLVVSVQEGPVEDEVYCCTLPPSHTVALGIGIVTGQCGEIVLRSMQFCNLTEIVVRPDDVMATLLRKVEIAAILGTFQATLTEFRYLRPEWKKNCEDERLLGVSMTGLMDHPVLGRVNSYAEDQLNVLRDRVHATNRTWAKKLGINVAAAATCVKPSGTVSQLVDSASGLHPRHAPFYLRRVQLAKTDPLYAWLVERQAPVEDLRSDSTGSTAVVAFPVAAPLGARTSAEVTGMQQLEHWLMMERYWCDHNPSITVHYREHEWFSVMAWLRVHWDEANGIALLPYDGHAYEQAPYEPITEEEYEAAAARFPALDFSTYREAEDGTTGSQELACTGDACEIP